MKNKKWKVIGWDTFSSEEYSISAHKTQTLAEAAAAEKMQQLEATQPSSTSGGQGVYGIQDQVYIERPDGSRYRWFTTSGTLAALTKDPAIKRSLAAQVAAAEKDLKEVRERATKLRKMLETKLKRMRNK